MEQSDVLSIVKTIASLPTIKIDRDEFLNKEFGRDYYNILDDILELGPYKAGVPIDVIEKKCVESINYETNKATAISFFAGLPGGLMMIGTIPTDIAQFMGHTLRICQKLAILTGMPSFSKLDEISDEEANIMLIYLGVMFGVGSANIAIFELSKIMAKNAANKIGTIALTKTAWYPLLKQILKHVGIKLTKQSFAKSAGKIIPVLG